MNIKHEQSPPLPLSPAFYHGNPALSTSSNVTEPVCVACVFLPPDMKYRFHEWLIAVAFLHPVSDPMRSIPIHHNPSAWCRACCPFLRLQKRAALIFPYSSVSSIQHLTECAKNKNLEWNMSFKTKKNRKWIRLRMNERTNSCVVPANHADVIIFL